MEADNSKSCTTLAECFSKHYKEITQGAYGLADKWPFAFDGLAENRKCAAIILLHEAYIDASSTFSHFKPERRPFPIWFFKIMYCVMLGKLHSLKQKRWQQVTPSASSAVEEDPPEGDPFDLFISPHCTDPQDRYVVVEQVNELLSSLNPRDRSILYHYAIRDRSGPEIAQRLDCSLDQFHTHLSYIRQHLRTIAQNDGMN